MNEHQQRPPRGPMYTENPDITLRSLGVRKRSNYLDTGEVHFRDIIKEVSVRRYGILAFYAAAEAEADNAALQTAALETAALEMRGAELANPARAAAALRGPWAADVSAMQEKLAGVASPAALDERPRVAHEGFRALHPVPLTELLPAQIIEYSLQALDTLRGWGRVVAALLRPKNDDDGTSGEHGQVMATLDGHEREIDDLAAVLEILWEMVTLDGDGNHGFNPCVGRYEGPGVEIGRTWSVRGLIAGLQANVDEALRVIESNARAAERVIDPAEWRMQFPGRSVAGTLASDARGLAAAAVPFDGTIDQLESKYLRFYSRAQICDIVTACGAFSSPAPSFPEATSARPWVTDGTTTVRPEHMNASGGEDSNPSADSESLYPDAMAVLQRRCARQSYLLSISVHEGDTAAFNLLREQLAGSERKTEGTERQLSYEHACHLDTLRKLQDEKSRADANDAAAHMASERADANEERAETAEARCAELEGRLARSPGHMLEDRLKHADARAYAADCRAEAAGKYSKEADAQKYTAERRADGMETRCRAAEARAQGLADVAAMNAAAYAAVSDVWPVIDEVNIAVFALHAFAAAGSIERRCEGQTPLNCAARAEELRRYGRTACAALRRHGVKIPPYVDGTQPR